MGGANCEMEGGGGGRGTEKESMTFLFCFRDQPSTANIRYRFMGFLQNKSTLFLYVSSVVCQIVG